MSFPQESPNAVVASPLEESTATTTATSALQQGNEQDLSSTSSAGSSKVVRRPTRHATILLEEGGIAATTDADEKAARRGMSKDGSIAGSTGLGGPGAGPPRRATMDSGNNKTLGRSFTSLFTPEHRLVAPPSHLQSLKNILFYNYLNILLICIPLSWILYFVWKDLPTEVGPDATEAQVNANINKKVGVFVVCFLGIMPLAQLLSYGTEEVALRVGQTLGALINATLGNAVELIVAIISLFHCELTIVQTSLVGSVLSNILLVLGTCFFVGGLRIKEQEFKQTAAQLNTSLLAMSVISVLIPAGFHATLGAGSANDISERSDLLKVSRGVAVLLLLIYGGYLFFSLSSHKHLYDDDEESEEEPTLSMPMAVGCLVVSTVLVGVTSEWLVDSIDPVSAKGVSKTWLGLILLPIVSNAAEHVTAVVASYKNKLDLALGVAVGSSVQIAIFVLPLLVVIAWIADKPLSLLFDPFVAIMLFLAVLIVNYAIADGRANYMEGYLLIQVYLIAALTFWFVDPDPSTQLFPDSLCQTGMAPAIVDSGSSVV